MPHEYLTMQQVDILLKCYYLRKVTCVAKVENTTVNKIRSQKENALRIIRLSYSQLYMQKAKFDGKLIIKYMAQRCGLETAELTQIINSYIIEGLNSDSKKYWERIKKEGEVPSADELLDFIYNKYEVDIEGEI